MRQNYAMVLNLDKQFNPYAATDTIPFEGFVFPGGEPHLRIQGPIDPQQLIRISHRVRSFADMGTLLLAVDALRRLGAQRMSLFLPYFPGARQDRAMVAGEPLTVKVYADMINALGFETVTVFDPHSEVTPALLDRCRVYPNFDFVCEVIKQIGGAPLLVSPDGGALKKIYKLSEALGGLEVLECSKSRDVKTGALSGFKVYADHLQGRDCLIVDDICDGGGTFVGLAEQLRAHGAGKLYLAVSHGIFSKGFEGLKAVFERVFTTDSFRSWEEAVGRLRVLNLHLRV